MYLFVHDGVAVGRGGGGGGGGGPRSRHSDVRARRLLIDVDRKWDSVFAFGAFCSANKYGQLPFYSHANPSLNLA